MCNCRKKTGSKFLCASTVIFLSLSVILWLVVTALFIFGSLHYHFACGWLRENNSGNNAEFENSLNRKFICEFQNQSFEEEEEKLGLKHKLCGLNGLLGCG